MARYTSGKQGVIPRYDIASILVFNERIYEYGDKVKVIILWKSVDCKPEFLWKKSQNLQLS